LQTEHKYSKSDLPRDKNCIFDKLVYI